MAKLVAITLFSAFVLLANRLDLTWTHQKFSRMWTAQEGQQQPIIRKWGCNRHETPLIFVHVGKAGGGMHRARFAGAALNYDRETWHRPAEDQHYYPVNASSSVKVGTTVVEPLKKETWRKAKFCNSDNSNHFPPKKNTFVPRYSFEGSLLCNATTPLGMAVGCPQPTIRLCLGCNDLNSEYCDTVYVGHNYLGNELHWLPPKYLKRWWEETWQVNDRIATASSSDNKHISDDDDQVYIQNSTWASLSPGKDEVWCEHGYRHQNRTWYRRPLSARMIDKGTFLGCGAPIAADMDRKFQRFWAEHHRDRDAYSQYSSSSFNNQNYAPLYASLPLHRVTVLRDPWSWLVSKFFWNHLHLKNRTCDKDLHIWTVRFVRDYLEPLCGEDCFSRYTHGMMTLEDMTVQAEGNLRGSFSVVGLLNETDTFYTMVSARIGYIDMGRNPHVTGDKHESAVGRVVKEESARCKTLFSDPRFQEEAKQQAPSLSLLDRVYQLGVEVNRFQREELNQCT